jgi:S-formylglutathione hydrolase FrmB
MARRRNGIDHHLRPARAAGGTQGTSVALIAAALLTSPAIGDVTLHLPDEKHVQPYTGRVYLVASQQWREPRHSNWWFNPSPLFHVDVEHWSADTPLVLGADTKGHPIETLGELPKGNWTLQAVIRTSDRSSAPLTGPGTRYSTPVQIKVDGVPEAELSLDQLETKPSQSRVAEGLQSIAIGSAVLSAHKGRKFEIRVAVLMPDELPETPLPTLYVIGGFPGSLDSAAMVQWLFGRQDLAKQMAIVYLEAEHRGGHSAFVDSAAGGPWGEALVRETIPALEAHFPLDARRDARFLTGHSSGGWTALWLALEHPEIFGGVISTAPDPVDFSHFQTVDIYAPDANIYRSTDGSRAPLARGAGQVSMWSDDFIAMESALGDGGQMRSFEWTFSPRGDDGQPVPLWNRDTGDIDPVVAEHWRRFDIVDRIAREWDTLEPILRDRVRVIMGTNDSFYLDAAARSMDTLLTNRGLPDVVELIPGDHSSILTRSLAKRIMQRALALAKVEQPTPPSPPQP